MNISKSVHYFTHSVRRTPRIVTTRVADLMCGLFLAFGILLVHSALDVYSENAKLRDEITALEAKSEAVQYWITFDGQCHQKHLRREWELAAAKNCEFNKQFLTVSR